MSIQDASSQFALDMNGLQRMQHTARQDPEAGVQGAAQQFEALFIQMMVKSMRDAIPTSGLMNSRDTDFYQSMLDQQWSQTMASRGIGLADALVAQLERQGAFTRSESPVAADNETQALIAGIPRGIPRVLDDDALMPAADSDVPEAGSTVAEQGSFLDQLVAIRQATSEPSTAENVTSSRPAREEREVVGHVRQFIDKLAEPAQAASATTGVPAELILAQAALETGWGRHEIATASGVNSHNLFGIKAGSRWQGATTDIVTHEYIDGQRTQVKDTFRVYDSFEHAFTDYANLIGNNPRYAAVLSAPDAAQAARALQQGGYATDPAYADKLVAIMNSMGPLDAGANFLADIR